MTALTRREFVALAGSAAAVSGCDLLSLIFPPPPPPPPLPAGTSRGRTASAELELSNGVMVPVAWSGRGGSHRLEVTSTGITIQVPTRSPQTLSFSELRMGMGHDTIRRFFGQPTLAALMSLSAA